MCIFHTAHSTKPDYIQIFQIFNDFAIQYIQKKEFKNAQTLQK